MTSLENKVSMKEKNTRWFLSFSITSLTQTLLLMYSDILTSCAEYGKSSLPTSLFFFLGTGDTVGYSD